MGISNITYREMESFFHLKDIDPSPMEVDMIVMFDEIAVDISREQQEKSQKQNKK